MRELSQVPYIAIDSNIELTESDYTFTGTGTVVVPFDMIEITGYAKFSDFAENEHIFISLLPLFDGQYWFFYFKGNLKVDRSQLDIPYYYQNDILNNSDDFTFFYGTTRKPLQINNINLFNKNYPYTYATRQTRTGVINNVPILETVENSDIFVGLDNLASPLNNQELRYLEADNRNYIYGVEQETFNGDFIKNDDGSTIYVWTDDDGNLHEFEGDEINGDTD